jgi:hypothetical protein
VSRPNKKDKKYYSEDMVFNHTLYIYDLEWYVFYAENEWKRAVKQGGVTVKNKPKGFELYTCTNCQELNVKRNNGDIRVGFCDRCGHPLWNPE